MNPEENDPAAKNEPQADDSTRKPSAKGAREMRLAADKVLKEKCKAIADALADSSLKGHIQSARFLYFLAAKHHESEAAEAVETLHSLALELVQQPEWSQLADHESANSARDDPKPLS
jgi:hypothetical protein